MRLTRTTIRIDGLQLFCRHGMFEEERRLGQMFSFDVTADLEACKSHADDALDHSVGYQHLIETVTKVATATIYHTLEKLCCCLAEQIFAVHAPVSRIGLRVRKLSPPLPATTSGVSVEITAERSES